MKLDPIFLVAPKPAVPSMPTRRAFLLAGTTFALGTGLGGACGYAIAAKAEPVVEEELKPSGDVDLDELRRLAVKAPIEELVGQRMLFLNLMSTDYRKDVVLWRGFERLCDAIERDPTFPDRRSIANVLAQTIDLGDPGFRQRFNVRVKELRSIK